MTVYKKNNKWYFRFQVNNKRYHGLCWGATTRQEAELYEAEFKRNITLHQKGILPLNAIKRIRLKTIKDNFLEYSRVNRSVYKQDKGRLRFAFEFFDENGYADEILRKDVEKFKNWLLANNRGKKTVNLYLGIFREMYNLAIEDELISKNPFANNVEFSLDPNEIRYLKDDEIENLLKVAPECMKPVITFALNTGLRLGNILDLKWGNIDFNSNIIKITRNKGKKYILLPINKTLIKLFKNLNRKIDYVFYNPNTGRQWKRTAFNELWRKTRDEASLSDFKFHGLRHTVCTKLVKNNVPIPIVRAIMYHTELRTTMRYCHIDFEDMNNALQNLWN